MVDKIQIITVESEVRELAYGITGTEYSTQKLQSAFKYGSALVANKTGIYVWSDSNPWYHVAVQAANYLAASNLIPKTFRDPDTQKSYWATFYESGLKEIRTINEGVTELQNGDAGSFIKIISSPSRNYYTNKKAKPFKSKEGWTGDYNKFNPLNYMIEKVK